METQRKEFSPELPFTPEAVPTRRFTSERRAWVCVLNARNSAARFGARMGEDGTASKKLRSVHEAGIVCAFRGMDGGGRVTEACAARIETQRGHQQKWRELT
jgi:hypothetical protein